MNTCMKLPHALTDDNVNHGNILELVKLVAESDNRLKEHIDRVVEASKKTLLKRQKDGKVDGNYGRGSLVTIFSHDNQNYSNHSSLHPRVDCRRSEISRHVFS